MNDYLLFCVYKLHIFKKLRLIQIKICSCSRYRDLVTSQCYKVKEKIMKGSNVVCICVRACVRTYALGIVI